MSLVKERKGASLLEYGILVGLISVLAIPSVVGLGKETRQSFFSTAEKLALTTDNAASSDPAPAPEPEAPPPPPPPVVTSEMMMGVNGQWIGVRSDYYSFTYGQLISFDGVARPVMLISNGSEVRLALEGDVRETLKPTILDCTDGNAWQISLSLSEAKPVYDNTEKTTSFSWFGTGITFQADQHYSCELNEQTPPGV